MTGPTEALHRVRVVDADRTLVELIEVWLRDAGCELVRDDAPGPCALVIADVPHARQGGDALLRRIASEHPGMPILALSTCFFPAVHACGPVAEALGVDCVLPKPVSRQALVDAVRHLLAR